MPAGATVDILMATCNGGRYVAEQIESILWQDFEDWQLLISDDCSDDGTLDVARSYAGRDPRVSIASEGVSHGSAKANFMHLLTLSNAPYAMFCDQDDVWLPEKVSVTLAEMRCLEAAHGAELPLLVFTDTAVVDECLRMVAPSFERYSHIDPARTQFRQLLAQSVGAGCTMMLNRLCVELVLEGADAIGQMVMHDWWACLVASSLGAIGYVDEATSLYRQHGDNAVGAHAYSPVRRASRYGEMVRSVALTVVQARAFEERYGRLLPEADTRALNAYMQSASTPFPVSLIHLVKSGCWKAGLRKMGQVLVLPIVSTEVDSMIGCRR